jgi:hypothetical protein
VWAAVLSLLGRKRNIPTAVTNASNKLQLKARFFYGNPESSIYHKKQSESIFYVNLKRNAQDVNGME